MNNAVGINKLSMGARILGGLICSMSDVMGSVDGQGEADNKAKDRVSLIVLLN